MTNLGREVRLGTASLQATGNLVDSSRINIKKYAGRTGVAMAITDYLLFVEHNVRKALELCAEATKAVCRAKILSAIPFKLNCWLFSTNLRTGGGRLDWASATSS